MFGNCESISKPKYPNAFCRIDQHVYAVFYQIKKVLQPHISHDAACFDALIPIKMYIKGSQLGTFCP